MTIFISILFLINTGFIVWVALKMAHYVKSFSDLTNRTIESIDYRLTSNESDIKAMKRHQESDDACHGLLSLRMNDLEKRINEPKAEVLHL